MEEVNSGYLDTLMSQIGISINKRQLCQFMDYYKLLIEWNEKINLTAITDFNDVCLKHFADSAALVKSYGSFAEMEKKLSGKSLCDVGTGAGFPGIPLKILLPGLRVSLFDSLDKRIHFLDTVISSLGLEDIEAVHGRAEDLARTGYRGTFDHSVARAVASLPVLCEYCIPFLKEGGTFIAYKSDAAEEISASSNALSVLYSEIVSCETFLLPGSDITRSIVMIQKKGPTKDAYPRKAGKPSKQPL